MKWPRQYAYDYVMAKGDREKEREAVAGCPPEWRDLVRKQAELMELAKRRKSK